MGFINKHASMVPHISLRIRLLLLILYVTSRKAHGLATPQPRKKVGRSPKVTGRKNQNEDRENRGYALRVSGVKTARQRPPRWETEGDSLFFPAVGFSSGEDIGGGTDGREEARTARDILREAFRGKEHEPAVRQPSADVAPAGAPMAGETSGTIHKQEVVDVSSTRKSPPSGAMWGTCSVGPVLGSRLSSMYDSPTPVQERAFSLLTRSKRTNAVIASPTGTGKTLAFLLPIMSTTRRSETASVIIVTPNIELSRQIQREVNKLWLPQAKSGCSACFVVQQRRHGNDEGGSSIEEESVIVDQITEQKPPIIAGTPRSLMALLAYCRKNEKTSLLSHLHTIVLDEADRLLQTETVARNRKAEKKEKMRIKPSPTEALLSELPYFGFTFDHYLNNAPTSRGQKQLKLVCASATVGRELRRQIMHITGAPSIDKAATLICDDLRTHKDAAKRRSSLLPPSLRHQYALSDVPETTGVGEDTIVDALWRVMQEFPPAPSIIFAGTCTRIVRHARPHLFDQGLCLLSCFIFVGTT
mmetsp:Transcript_14121/g.28146  ORF Transcript_14121/g.28146 Transcript_14121/m.28146 type:complete len:530 (+) Transcript_14121:1-1590(+)